MTYVRSRNNPPKQGPPIRGQLQFRPLTAEVVRKEYASLLAGGAASVDDFRRVASRLNVWLSQPPAEDADLASMVE